MKQNYKIYLCALLLVGATGMMTAGAAKMAVLVVGLETDAASDAFATGIRYEFTQKGYELVDNDAVKAKLATLRQRHKDGHTVDTVDLATWGKDKGLDFVQLVVESDCSITIGTSTMDGREQVIQVVSCGTTKYSGRGYYRTRFVTHEEVLHREIVKDMVFVAGGVFEMGCKSGRDASCASDELPSHWVRVNNFYIGKYEVTQALWKRVMGSLPSSISSGHLGNNKPVIYVSWNNIMGSGGFLETLNALTGKNYRLPTEAEWEYAARGCSGGVCESYNYSGSNTVGDVAYYNYSSGGPATVGTKQANKLGIYDMSGNVYEWCSDMYSSSYYSSTYTKTNPQDNPKCSSSSSSRVARSGSWCTSASYCRAAVRHNSTPGPNFVNNDLGFRLVLP